MAGTPQSSTSTTNACQWPELYARRVRDRRTPPTLSSSPTAQSPSRKMEPSSPSPNSGTFAVRAGNVAQRLGAIDIYLTSPGADLASTAPTIINAALQHHHPLCTRQRREATRCALPSTEPRMSSMTLGRYHLRRQDDRAGNRPYGKGSGKLARLDMLNLNTTQGAGQFFQNTLARFKLVNASAVGSAAQPICQWRPDTYQCTLCGGFELRQDARANRRPCRSNRPLHPGASLLTFMADFSPSTDSSIVVSGSAGRTAVAGSHR